MWGRGGFGWERLGGSRDGLMGQSSGYRERSLLGSRGG